MKKIFYIHLFVLSIFITKDTKAQGVPDTIAYLQTIVSNKAQYIGQPFSVLLSSLQIQIKYFHPIANKHQDKSKETSTSFAFYFPQTENDMYLTYPCLNIYWESYLNATQSYSLYNSNNGGGWSSSVAAFYANAIIADIKVRE